MTMTMTMKFILITFFALATDARMGVKIPPGGFEVPWGKGKDPPYEYVICFKKGCLPSTKPRLCSDKVWDVLQEWNDAKRCQDEPIIGALPPAYLSIRGHEDCLGTMKDGSSTQWCIPTSKPNDCDTQVWEQVKESFVGDTCPLPGKDPMIKCEFKEEIEDFKQEMSTMKKELIKAIRAAQSKNCRPIRIFKKVSHPEVLENCTRETVYEGIGCLPPTRPRFCHKGVWETLQEKFDGERCPDDTTILAAKLAPEYLSIKGHEDCLGTIDKGSLKGVRCQPSTRPKLCIPHTWNLLKEKFFADICPDEAIIGNPRHSIKWIRGHEYCLGTVHKDSMHQCLPSTRPDLCIPSAWYLLQDKFDNDERC